MKKGILLIILLLIIAGELTLHEFMLKHKLLVDIVDWIIIGIFAIDLIFKYMRSKNFPRFIRASWIDIIAIFPFFLIFRLVNC